MKQVSITSHIGRAQHDLKTGKDTRINNANDLAKTEKHNNHDYDPIEVALIESNIDMSLKSENKQYDENLNQVKKLDLVDTVKKIYHREFDEVVDSYNQQQIGKGHKERCIDDYFKSISDNQKQELAVEGIIQFGDMDDWKEMSIEDKRKAEPILLKGLQEVLKISGVRLAGASLHLNETSPHLHYVVVCVDEAPRKTGLQKRVNKSKVFTKDVLSKILQDNVRRAMQSDVEEIFGWTFKEKSTGRNQDLSKNQLKNEVLIKENLQVKTQVEQLQQQITRNELKIKEQVERINKQEAIIKHNSSVLATKKQIYDRYCEDIPKLEEKYNSLKKKIQSLIEEIKPLERLKGMLKLVRDRAYEFRSALNQINMRYDVSKQEEEALKGFWNVIDGKSDVDKAIEYAERFERTKSHSKDDDFER